MDAHFVEIPDMAEDVPLTLEDYHAKIRSDPDWRYSIDAQIFRMALRGRTLLKLEDVEFSKLIGTFGLLIRLEEGYKRHGRIGQQQHGLLFDDHQHHHQQ